MEQATLARPFVLIAPDNIAVGDHLKLKHGDRDSHIIVRVRKMTAPQLLRVLSFEDGEEYTLDMGAGRPCLCAQAPGTTTWFLQADKATPDEVSAYAAKRRAELNAVHTNAARQLGRFEREVGRDYLPSNA